MTDLPNQPHTLLIALIKKVHPQPHTIDVPGLKGTEMFVFYFSLKSLRHITEKGVTITGLLETLNIT